MIENADALHTCSLVTSDKHPVPLEGVSIAGEVLGAHARLVVRQRYKNTETRPIEAIYTFPVPSNAVLVGFAMECAGRRLEGEVKEREAAFHDYDEAIAKGHGAALLDQERKNVFTASVGNLLPGEETVIEVAYVQHLSADEGSLRLMIPTLVAPRYMPGAPAGDRSGHGAADPTTRVPDADRISPSIADVSYGLSLDVVFDLGRALSVESPSHAVVVHAEKDHRVRVTFQRDEVPLDRDIVILASGAGTESAGVTAERSGSGEGTFALTVVPDLFDGTRAFSRDVVFVVDVSGSMQGASIEQAQSALRLCLRHLAEGDRFNVIAFSTTFRSFEPALVPFTQRTLEAADSWVEKLDAGGGTEMLEPLLAAKAAFADAKRDAVLVLLTDGQVGNESEIAKRVTENLGRVRIYTFGIGTNVSDLLLRDLARRSHGAAEFIHPGERIDEKVTAQFARATAARVDGVTMKLVGVDAGELTPAELPALVDGEPWVVYGRYETARIGRAEIRGTLRGEPFFLEVPVDLPANENRPTLPALWAALRVRDLEDAEEGLSGRRAEGQKARIVALATTHKVASKYTSFIVVEKRSGDRRSSGTPEARAIPVNAPAGWSATQRAPKIPLKSRLGKTAFGLQSRVGTRPSMVAAAAPMMPASFGAPPPPPGFAPPAPAVQPPQARAPGILGKAKAVIGDLLSSAGSFDVKGLVPAPKPEKTGVSALFERQLASGLWAGETDDDAARLFATARALAACFAEGVDTAHPVFGAPLKKAIAAIRALAERLANKPEVERAIMAAYAAAFLVASGPRLRAQVLDAARASASPSVKGLAATLTDAAAAKKKLVELGAA